MIPKLRQELMEYLNKVPDEKLAQVLAFVRALGVPGPTGLSGEKLKSAVKVCHPARLTRWRWPLTRAASELT